MFANIATLARSKDLLYMLVWRDIRVRYKQSIMGFFWAILMPGLVVGAGILVRVAASQFSGSKLTADTVASVMVRAVAWSFFIGGIRFGTQSLVGNSGLVTKIAFPKEVFPISAVLANLFDFVIAFTAVTVILFFLGWTPTLNALWAIPVLLVLCALTTGLSIFLSAANLFLRDVKYLVEAFLTYAIFFTPVLYEASSLGKYKPLVMLNPVAPLLEGFSAALVAGQPPERDWMLYSTIFSLIILCASYSLFKRLESTFAESI